MPRHVPPGVSACLKEGYDATDNDAYLIDVYYPSSIENTGKALAAVVCPRYVLRLQLS